MPDFQIYTPGEEHILHTVYFKLSSGDGDGVITLRAYDKDGTRRSAGHIFSLSPSEGLFRATGVNRDLGIPLDEQGRIRLTNRLHF